MPDEYRTSDDSESVTAIGELFTFLLSTSGIVECCSRDGRLRPGFLNKWRLAKKPMTTGTVGEKFKKAVSESSDPARPLSSRLKEAARAFVELTGPGIKLVHAHVYSEPDGRQQLIYQGKNKTRT